MGETLTTDGPAAPFAGPLTDRHVAVAAGRTLHVASAGAGPPRVLYDAGAFGIYADGSHVVRALAGRGVSAATHSRAGLGDSAPVPAGVVPGPHWHADDMARLLDALGAEGKVVLVGHSMAGLRLHAFAERHPGRTAGLVLVDAVTPAQLASRLRRRSARVFARSLMAGEALSRFAGPLSPIYPDGMRLPPRERRDKMRSVGSRGHIRATRIEIIAATEATLKGRIVPAPVPTVLMPAGLIAYGSDVLAAEASAAGRHVEVIDMRRWNHASVLSPEPAGTIAAAAIGLLER